LNRTDASLIALRKILRATEMYGRKLARTAGLTPVQIRVLQIAARSDDVTPKQISQGMKVSPATISTLLDRLAAKNMIVRQKSNQDRRKINIIVTEEGRKSIAAAPDALQSKYSKEFELLTDWEQAMIIASLERVAGMLDAEDYDAAPVLTIGELHHTS
jgi:DNA-binding MarR family transcriptional regulator